MKKEQLLKITFDPSLAKWMIATFAKDMQKKCRFCGKRVNARNLGAITNGGMMCKNIVCLVEYVNEKEKRK